MATAHPLPAQVPTAPPTELAREAQRPETPEARLEAEEALVSVPGGLPAGKPLELTSAAARLPVEVDVAVPIREFRVRNLLTLEPGHLIETQWNHGDDLPIQAGDVQLAWSEFEVVDTLLAVRVTRLA